MLSTHGSVETLHELLIKVLCVYFVSRDEFLHFLHYELGSAITAELPVGTSLAVVVSETLALLTRRGSLDETFGEALCRTKPEIRPFLLAIGLVSSHEQKRPSIWWEYFLARSKGQLRRILHRIEIKRSRTGQLSEDELEILVRIRTELEKALEEYETLTASKPSIFTRFKRILRAILQFGQRH